MKSLGAVLPLLSLGMSGVPSGADLASYFERNAMSFAPVGTSWMQGPFLGNGVLGAVVLMDADEPGALRIELNRSDLYSERNRGFRVPSSFLRLKGAGAFSPAVAKLSLHDAEATGEMKDTLGTLRWTAWVEAQGRVLRFSVDCDAPRDSLSFEAVPVQAVYTRKKYFRTNLTLNPEEIFPAPVQGKDAFASWVIQPWVKAGGSTTALRWRKVSPTRFEGLVVLETSYEGKASPEPSLAVLREAEKTSFAASHKAHVAWWHDFHAKSFVSVPDAAIESHYVAQIYKLGSAVRGDGPVLDLFGPWFDKSPWLAVWHNLNIQLAYWPIYAANHLELGDSMVRMVRDGKERLVEHVKNPEWRKDSAFLPRATPPDLTFPKPGFVIDPDIEIGNLAFLCHNLWWQARYASDSKLMSELVLPLLARAVGHYAHLLKKKDDGKLHLPLAISPEYEVKAEDTNYDLSLLRWGLETLIASAPQVPGHASRVEAWKRLRASLPEFAVNSNGYMIGKDVGLDHSHRHFSHLFMVYPLALVDGEGKDRPLVEKSIRHWLGMPKALAGYSFTGGAAMAARLGDGDTAVSLLRDFFARFSGANTHYQEAGPCIETPLSAARGLQEMLLQSHGGRLRVFPAVPAGWRDASFASLRGEGAFLVSAVRKEGKTAWIRIESLAGEPCVLVGETPDLGKVRASRSLGALTKKDGLVVLPLKRGEWIELGDPCKVEAVARTGSGPWGNPKRL